MLNKKIPWWKPQIGEKEKKFIKKAIDDNYINEGKLTTEFEEKIRNLVKVKYAVATTSGTMAIFLALKALGIGRGDEVIVPDITFIATANAVDLCGAKPVFVDIDKKNLNINPLAISKAITKRTKAIIPVHVTGRAADMSAILKIAKERKIFVIEDAAEALMSKSKGKFLGTIGDAGVFSFSANKTVSTGQGGMVVTNNKKLFKAIKTLKDQGRPKRGTGGDDIHNTIGYNFKFTDLQAAVGLGQIAYLQKRIKRMKRNYQLYVKNLKLIKEIKIFKTNISSGEVPQWTDAIVEKRDRLEKYLKSKNIDCRKYWHPIHRQLAYKMSDKNFPNSIEVSPKAIWFPSAFTLSDKEINKVCFYIKNFFGYRK